MDEAYAPVGNNNASESYSSGVSPSELEEARQYTRYKIASWLDAYSTYILTAVALVGNSVALVTICSMRPRTSTSIYIATLAVVDTLCLVFKLLTVHLVRYPAIPEEFACGFMLSVFFVVQYAASWLIVVISVERFVAVWFPFKVSLMFTKRKAVFILSTMFTIFLPLSVWTFWFYTRYESEYWGHICVHRRRYDDAMDVMRKIHPIIYILIPFFLILVFNVLIIVGLRRANRRRKQVNRNGNTSVRSDHRLTAMLLTTALVFLFFEILMVILTLFRHYSTAGAESFVEDFFFVELAQTLEDTNHAVNFFLYFCSGAKFRETLFQLFRNKILRRHPHLSLNSRISSYKVSRVEDPSKSGQCQRLAETRQ